MRDSGDFVKSFAKGLQIITLFSAEKSQVTLAEAAELTGMTRAAARRFWFCRELCRVSVNNNQRAQLSCQS